jgi:hypothetical protein
MVGGTSLPSFTFKTAYTTTCTIEMVGGTSLPSFKTAYTTTCTFTVVGT